MKPKIVREYIRPGQSIGCAVGRIEALPVEDWPAELAKIDNDQDRQAVRSDLKTIYKLRRADEINN